jgi:hypothetical protein
MNLSSLERQRLKDLVLGHCADWPAFHSKLKARNLTISQSSLDRFFSGRSKSARTLRTLAISLGTTPEALESQIRILAHATRPVDSDALKAVRPLSDPDAFRIAFQLWVEMTTRKLGLPIDPAQDVIAECYDSWYAFFKSARELIKAIPLHEDPRSPELRRLVQLSQAVLNDGLRPHLQSWQAKFRRWSNNSVPAQASNLSPQEAQQRFPEWSALQDDLLATNERLISYVEALETMIARPVSRQPRGKLAPTQKVRRNPAAQQL